MPRISNRNLCKGGGTGGTTPPESRRGGGVDILLPPIPPPVENCWLLLVQYTAVSVVASMSGYNPPPHDHCTAAVRVLNI